MHQHTRRAPWTRIALFALGFALCTTQASAADASNGNASARDTSIEDKAYPSAIASVDSAQNERLINCMVAATTSSKLLDERTSGKSDEDIIRQYRERLGEEAAGYARQMLSNLDADKPEENDFIGYGITVFGKCLGGSLDEEARSTAVYCYRQSQLIQIAFAFRAIGEPMEKVFGKPPVPDDVRPAYDALLARAAGTTRDDNAEAMFRLSTFYRCIGHPELWPAG
jgi:hypothetical protein